MIDQIDETITMIFAELKNSNIKPEDYGIESGSDLIEFALGFLLSNIDSAFED